MRLLIPICVLVLGCGNVKNQAGDAAVVADTARDTGSIADAPPVMLTCQSYCQGIIAACTGANNQYDTMPNCLASCAAYPMGALNDQSGNTLGCRISHTMLAQSDPATHCIHAGPSGASVCGTPCQGFCTIDQHVCTGSLAQYQDDATCQSACAGFATQPPYSASVTSGNSLSCRIYHAIAASTGPQVHCGHTAVQSATCQ
jgi:hypothetical protein